MHPLDSSLDASVHGHGPHRRVVRRRSSIDNGLFGAANKELMITRMRSGSSSDGSTDGFFDEYVTRSGQRRLSLNLNNPTNTTFLASTTVTSNAEKCDLDKDCHLWSNEDSAMHKRNGGAAAESAHSRRSQGSSRHSHVAASAVVHPDDDSTVSLDGSEDSFCEATGAEPANQEYMMQDLGASCFWNDVDLYPELLQRRRTPGRTVSHETEDESPASHRNGVDKLQDMSTDELDYEPSIVVVGVDHEPVVSYHTSTTDEIVDDIEDDADLLYAEDEMQFLQEELLLAETTTFLQDDDIDHAATDAHIDHDLSSDCDSFCDAEETERANAEYLATDLGASCCWCSTDDLLVEMADRHTSTSGSGSGNTVINTITEEN